MVARRWQRGRSGWNLPAVDPEQEYRGSGNSMERNRHDKPKEKLDDGETEIKRT